MNKEQARGANDNYLSGTSPANPETKPSTNNSASMPGILRRVSRATWLSLSTVVIPSHTAYHMVS